MIPKCNSNFQNLILLRIRSSLTKFVLHLYKCWKLFCVAYIPPLKKDNRRLYNSSFSRYSNGCKLGLNLRLLALHSFILLKSILINVNSLPKYTVSIFVTSFTYIFLFIFYLHNIR